MKTQTKFQFLATVLMLTVIQSCYTVVNAPATLPETVTTTISGPVYASSGGVASVYGWDPYWEPSLAYTPYHRSYGASYYNPYNYYDYQHSYYAPVYGGGDYEATPVAGRGYDRDDQQGGSRNRQSNGGSTALAPIKSGGMPAVGVSTASPVTPNPVIVPPPTKTIHPQNVEGSKRTRDVKPSQSGKVGSTKQVKESARSKKSTESSKESTEPTKKRFRTRK